MIAVWIILGVVAVVCLIGLLMLVIRRWPRRVSIPEAKRRFEQQLEGLQSSFFHAAASTGKPRGLSWKSCEFGREFDLARDKNSGELMALLPVTIAFEAIPGSDMEGLPAVGNLRSATAVFILCDGLWTTNGRAVFNMSPAETLQYFHDQYELISANELSKTDRGE